MKKDWKGSPPRVTSVAIVDDDETRRKQLTGAIENAYPTLDKVRSYETIFECYQGFQHWDYLIIDVSSVAPLMMGDVQHAYAPIAKFMETHPETTVIILSAMGRASTEEVVSQVVEAMKAEDARAEDRVKYGGTGDIQQLVALVKEMIKPVDLEWTKIKHKKKK
jgi:DNA-binding NtrC family response regulator